MFKSRKEAAKLYSQEFEYNFSLSQICTIILLEFFVKRACTEQRKHQIQDILPERIQGVTIQKNIEIYKTLIIR